MKRDLLRLFDLKPAEIEKILERAASFKKRRGAAHRLKGKTLAMLFEKASTRTRVSFEVAVHELGGYAVCLEGGTTQVGRGERPASTASRSATCSRQPSGVVGGTSEPPPPRWS